MTGNFEFVLASEPNGVLSSAERKRVRARAARNPWNRDQPILSKKERSRKITGDVSATEAVLFSDHAICGNTISLDTDLIEATIERACKRARSEDYVETHVLASWHGNTRATKSAQTPRSWKTFSMHGFEPPTFFRLRGIGATNIDPFWTLPMTYEPIVSAALDHHVHNLKPASAAPATEANMPFLKWFFVAMADPAYLYASLLFSASHMLSDGDPHVTAYQVMRLKGLAIAAINGALCGNAERATSDAVIAAVLVVGATELAFGDSDSYGTHLNGCMKQIAVRGGVSKLNPLFAQILRWTAVSDHKSLVYPLAVMGKGKKTFRLCHRQLLGLPISHKERVLELGIG